MIPSTLTTREGPGKLSRSVTVADSRVAVTLCRSIRIAWLHREIELRPEWYLYATAHPKIFYSYAP
jgi:hypothetical protein